MIRKCVDPIEELYESFPKKDMTLKDFRRAYLAATSPTKLRTDLTKIVQRREMTRTRALLASYQKQKIDSVLPEKL